MVGTPRMQAQKDLFADVQDPDNRANHQRRRQLRAAQSEAVDTVKTSSAVHSPVWICLHFPGLPIQALRSRCSVERPSVVVSDQRHRTLIATNRAARRCGLVSGQHLRTAMALCADLLVLEREPELEAALLSDIAQRLMSVSPQVSMQSSQSILLEVSGSLKLFQGIDAVLARVLGLCMPDYHVRHAVAPTPMAASWLVSGGLCPEPAEVVEYGTRARGFQQLFNALDLSVTQWPDITLNTFREMGVYTIGECRRLPRDGLARRFGVSVPQSLAQALGELPDIRDVLVPPPQFDAVAQLDAEITTAPALQPVCESLLRQLEIDLRCRQSAVRKLRFQFHAWRGQAGALELSLCAPGYRLQDWVPVLQAELDHLKLQQPVVAVSLSASANDALQAHNHTLSLSHEEQAMTMFDEGAAAALLDRLRARLGEQAIARLVHVAEHRPECASQMRSVFEATTRSQPQLPCDWQITWQVDDASVWLQRPLWLLERPQSLRVSEGVPYHIGALTLSHGPERISAGWWEHSDSVRDYFVATDIDAARLWVFRTWGRDRQAQWWLHGVFG